AAASPALAGGDTASAPGGTCFSGASRSRSCSRSCSDGSSDWQAAVAIRAVVVNVNRIACLLVMNVPSFTGTARRFGLLPDAQCLVACLGDGRMKSATVHVEITSDPVESRIRPTHDMRVTDSRRDTPANAPSSRLVDV